MALLGVNGAGKTTLFSLVTRLYDNVSGRIAVFGHDVRRDPGAALAELGVVFQSRALDADLTIAQNLAYHAALHGLPRAVARRARRRDRRGGRADRGRHTRVARLSGGQQRRAEIARALLHEPRLLLLDEATVGLDVQLPARGGAASSASSAPGTASACSGPPTSSTRSSPPTASSSCTAAGCSPTRRPPRSPATAASPTASSR